MDPSSTQRAEELFVEALGLPESERASFLDASCGSDIELRRAIEVLLAARALAADYFERLPQRLGVTNLVSRHHAGEAGQRFGQYTLTTLLGSGGMGSVWRAVRSDGRFEGDVAVKLLSRAAGDAGSERFAREARYLARLTHPNIARLIDAGIGTGEQPYLVLEYVEGLAIDEHCDEHALSVAGRIELFLQVLDAAAHAHAHLIVHRDIKPSNVQVTSDGSVKLLDFGIAKLLGEETPQAGTELTRLVGVVLTPEFAAPEQLEGGEITTSTDIYSLGMLLWLLVVGRNPRETHTARTLVELRALASRQPTTLVGAIASQVSADELKRLARQRSTNPTALLKTLRSDLDSIVRKAIATDPQDRYVTAADFAQDLRRYLRHEPVTSQVSTMRYRVRKFVRRHRGGVLTATLTVVAIVTAVGVAIWQGIEARQQRDLAVYQQQRTQATNQFMNLLLSEIGPQGKPLTVVELLDRAMTMLDRQYGIEQRFLAPMYYELANVYFSLARNDKLVELLGRAEQVARQQGDDGLLASVLCTQSRVNMRSDPALARQKHAEGHAAMRRMRSPSIESTASCARADALLLELDGDRQGAIERMEQTLRAVEADPLSSVPDRLRIANELARLHYNARNLDRASQLNQQILEHMRSAGLGQSTGYLVIAINGATLLQTMGEYRRAHEVHRELLQRFQWLDATSQPVGLASAYGIGLLRLARYDEAREVLTRQRDAAHEAGNSFEKAESELLLGRLAMLTGNYDQAWAHLDLAEREFLKAPQSNARQLEVVPLFRAQTLLRRGDAASARDLITATLQRLEYPERKDAPGVMNTLRVAAEIAIELGDAAAALRYAADFHDGAVALARSPQESADVGQALVLRAAARRLQGDRAGADADLGAAVVSLTNGFGPDHPETRSARALLGR